MLDFDLDCLRHYHDINFLAACSFLRSIFGGLPCSVLSEKCWQENYTNHNFHLLDYGNFRIPPTFWLEQWSLPWRMWRKSSTGLWLPHFTVHLRFLCANIYPCYFVHFDIQKNYQHGGIFLLLSWQIWLFKSESFLERNALIYVSHGFIIWQRSKNNQHFIDGCVELSHLLVSDDSHILFGSNLERSSIQPWNPWLICHPSAF